jgi:hypothetical protein
MKGLLTSWELTPLFASEGNFCTSGGIEGELKLLSVNKAWALASLFVLYWKRTMPKSFSEWVTWGAAYIAVFLIITFVSNHGKIELGTFLVSFLPLTFPILRCYMNAVSKYGSAAKRCVTVVNADKTQPPLTEGQIRAILRSHPETLSLNDFKHASQKRLLSTSKSILVNK